MTKTTLDTETLSGFELALTEIINGVSCEFYKGSGFKGAITREKLGAALGYSNPRVALAIIHKKHKERLDINSAVIKLITTDGKSYDTYIYSLKGALEICRWSRSSAADAVMDTLYDVFEKLITAGSVSIEDLPSILSETITKNPAFAYESVVPALKNRQLNQRKLLGDIVGVVGYTASGSDIEKLFEINSIARKTLEYWEKHEETVFTSDNLPISITSNVEAMRTITKWSKLPSRMDYIVNYCGSIYFNGTGLREIIDYGVKRKILTGSAANEWLEVLNENKLIPYNTNKA